MKKIIIWLMSLAAVLVADVSFKNVSNGTEYYVNNELVAMIPTTVVGPLGVMTSKVECNATHYVTQVTVDQKSGPVIGTITTGLLATGEVIDVLPLNKDSDDMVSRTKEYIARLHEQFVGLVTSYIDGAMSPLIFRFHVDIHIKFP